MFDEISFGIEILEFVQILDLFCLIESDSACIVILISFYGLRTRLPVSNFICLVCDVRTVGTESKFG